MKFNPDIYLKMKNKKKIKVLEKLLQECFEQQFVPDKIYLLTEFFSAKRFYEKEKKSSSPDPIYMKMKVKDIMSNGLWDKYCSITGTNEWAMNEGLMDKEEFVGLTRKQALKLGLIRE